MDAAIDAVLAKKFSKEGIFKDARYFAQTMKPGLAPKFLAEAPPYPKEAIACVRAVCRYIYETYGRFPAHCNAMHAPLTWFQAHHIALDYYDTFYEGAYSPAAAAHQQDRY
ncbi:MAG: hypothetical protein ACYDCQ_18860, partial [Dehalococcoidia bacterium]